ncbi:GAF domain-containing protein [Spirillospora sp. NPDC047279]|uniref:GAF domain-containing protein n=1 Tax=Spirillospora sp. NPDC047279 TaxID=3155478 RepID=UPI0034101011
MIADALASTLATTANAAEVGGTGLILVTGGRARAIGGSDQPSMALAGAQVTMGSGPAFRSMVSGEPVAIHDVVADYPFGHPELAPYSGPVHAILSVPIRIDAVVTGALDLYDHTAHGWPARKLTAGRELAQVMAAVLHLLASDPAEAAVSGSFSGVPQ